MQTLRNNLIAKYTVTIFIFLFNLLAVLFLYQLPKIDTLIRQMKNLHEIQIQHYQNMLIAAGGACLVLAIISFVLLMALFFEHHFHSFMDWTENKIKDIITWLKPKK